MANIELFYLQSATPYSTKNKKGKKLSRKKCETVIEFWMFFFLMVVAPFGHCCCFCVVWLCLLIQLNEKLYFYFRPVVRWLLAGLAQKLAH